MSPPPRTAASAPGHYVALLRGINVGGKNKLPMRDLVTLCEDAGCRDVVTYIQSGNVVLTAETRVASRLATDLSARIERAFGLSVPVVLRAAEDLARVLAHNPFVLEGADENALHVMFLADAPDARALATLDPNRSPPDRFTVVGREIYLHCPGGVARTKLSNAYFDTRLATTSTARNWRTVATLARMATAR